MSTPEGSKRSSAILDNLEYLGEIPDPGVGPSGHRRDGSSEKEADSRLSAFLRENAGHTSKEGSQDIPLEERPPAPSFTQSSHERGKSGSSGSPGHTVARTDIRASAVKILYTYLIPGSEREIVLPEDMVTSIIDMVERDGRDDPEVFDSAKDYVFQAMERDAFPGFLQAKALGNLVPLSIVIRLAIALASFGGAFWAAFFVILTDKPRDIRCWVRSFPYFLLKFLPNVRNRSFSPSPSPVISLPHTSTKSTPSWPTWDSVNIRSTTGSEFANLTCARYSINVQQRH